MVVKSLGAGSPAPLQYKEILMRKLFFVLFAVSALSLYAQSYEAEKNFMVEYLSGGKSVRIIKYTGKNTSVNIPRKLKNCQLSKSGILVL